MSSIPPVPIARNVLLENVPRKVKVFKEFRALVVSKTSKVCSYPVMAGVALVKGRVSVANNLLAVSCREKTEISSEEMFTVSVKARVSLPLLTLRKNSLRAGSVVSGVKLLAILLSALMIGVTGLPATSRINSAAILM